jgi:hypothetical protein
MEAPVGTDLSTWRHDLGAPLDERGERGAAWARRATLAVLACVVAFGLSGLLGVHSSTATATRLGYTMTLDYPAVARAGLDVPWKVSVQHPGGFGKELTLAVTGDYFDIFETQAFHPEPAEETRDGDTLYLRFTAPPGDTFVVSYDAYIQPASQRGGGGTLSVLDGGVPVASVDFDTRLLP